MPDLHGTVLVVDDEPRDNAMLSDQLRKQGHRVESVAKFEEFLDAAEVREYDAAFLDWELDEINRGPDMLRFLKGRQPLAARIVVTKHQKQTAQATQFGADLLIPKSLPEDDKVRLEGHAVKLGVLLQINNALASFGGMVADFPRRIPVPEDLENRLKLSTTDYCDRLTLCGTDFSDLRAILCRYGWRPQFDMDRYMNASWNTKVAILIGLVKLDAAEIGAICATRADLIEKILRGEIGLRSGPHQTMRILDSLLSVLAFILEVSDYDPPAVAVNFRNPDLGSRAIDPPPWKGIGIATYLREAKQPAVIECLCWIRGN